MMDTLHSREVWIAALGLTFLLLAGFGVFARWCSFSPAVRGDRLGQLRVGMTMDEVRALLGAPRRTKTGESGLRQWIYGAPMKRHVLLIEFSSRDQLQSFGHGVPFAKPPHPHSSEA
jgi:outer membrane protein assembly factor BamE (lipoprotein component of BamABCDE complex)